MHRSYGGRPGAELTAAPRPPCRAELIASQRSTDLCDVVEERCQRPLVGGRRDHGDPEIAAPTEVRGRQMEAPFLHHALTDHTLVRGAVSEADDVALRLVRTLEAGALRRQLPEAVRGG